MESRPGFSAIYGLYCPETGALRYIGKTNHPRKRLGQHTRGNSGQLHMPVVRWCRDLRKRGLQPRMEVLTWCRDWETAERRIIAAYRKTGTDLLNVADGGAHVPPHRVDADTVIPTGPVFRAAMVEVSRVQRSLVEGESPAAPFYRDLMGLYRAVRRDFIRKGRRESAIAFDLGLWAHFVLRDPIDWDMVLWRPTEKSRRQKRPAIAAVRDMLARYRIPLATV